MSIATPSNDLFDNGFSSRIERSITPVSGDSLAFQVSAASSGEATLSLEGTVGESLTDKPVYEFCKRCLDIAVCLLLLPLALPIIAICAAAVWFESPGKVIFRQSRTGKDGRRFRMFKIRTMVANAEQLKEKYRHLNELTWPDFKITNDPRVTRVGRFLRKTSLDELPQILNVLLGDMSLVGPRPTSFSADTYQPWHFERLAVTPGITGLWQIQGRANIDFDDRVRLDIQYVRTRSFWLDIKILFATVFAVLLQRGAK
ncbi:MAG: sugar transferase [Pirellulales bacterium]